MLNVLDWLIIGAYFVLVFVVALFTSRQKDTLSSAQGYFLAGRNAGWFVIGSSLFASNIGSEHLVGLAGTGASSGVAVGHFEVLACLVLLLLAWFFVPFYLKSGVFTMPEFLEKRYSPAARWYLAVVSIVSYVLTKISVMIAAGGIVFQTLMGIDFWTGAVIVVIATGLYTIFGGLRAVLYTDLFQMFVLVAGSAMVAILGLQAVGGWTQLRSIVGSEFFNMWKPLHHPDFPWTGIILGAPILGVWYWCTDQFIVQRVLSAPTVSEARRGAFFGSFLKFLPIFIFVIPGVIAAALVKTGRIQLTQSDQALPTLIATILPSGIRGLVVAGLLAALMSSLSGVFNSCSTLVTWDLYKKWNPGASQKKLVRVGQLSTGLMVVLGLLWIPLMKLISGQIYTYLQSVQAYIAPPITAVFLIGLLWRRINSTGAMAALLFGSGLGLLRLILELIKGRLGNGFWFHFADINFLHFAALLFLTCAAVLILVSLCGPAPQISSVANLTLQTLSEQPEKMPNGEKGSFWADVGITGLVVAGVLATWIYFTG